ncbi:MAG TPA: hypothetical protein PK110_02235 [Niabella sp.]|nr:hypothetical protein [Chitinophagaceae bacterium]HRN48013.1 hypothetical protein [Niabella sp.]HRO83620.1 hypothetical protein [Niabella sp.]
MNIALAIGVLDNGTIGSGNSIVQRLELMNKTQLQYLLFIFIKKSDSSSIRPISNSQPSAIPVRCATCTILPDRK